MVTLIATETDYILSTWGFLLHSRFWIGWIDKCLFLMSDFFEMSFSLYLDNDCVPSSLWPWPPCNTKRLLERYGGKNIRNLVLLTRNQCKHISLNMHPGFLPLAHSTGSECRPKSLRGCKVSASYYQGTTWWQQEIYYTNTDIQQPCLVLRASLILVTITWGLFSKAKSTCI